MFGGFTNKPASHIGASFQTVLALYPDILRPALVFPPTAANLS